MRLGDPQEIGRLMRERRKQLGFTQEQMAQAVGLSPITIIRIENGQVGYIHAKTAKALEVPKRLTKRMVMETVAVTQDGNDVVLPPLKVLTAGNREAAINSAPTPMLRPSVRPIRQYRRVNKIHNPAVKSQEIAKRGNTSVRQRFLRWIGSEFTRMAE